MKKITIIFAIVILTFAVGGWYFLSEQEEVEETPFFENMEVAEQKVREREAEVETETKEQENPYVTAQTVEPIEEDNITMHKDFGAVLREVFGEEPKLVETGGITRLSYIVNRVITTDDVMEAKNLLAEKGYELQDSSTKEDRYEINLSVSEDVLEEKYNGDVGGSMYINFWTAEEGEEMQRVVIKTL